MCTLGRELLVQANIGGLDGENSFGRVVPQPSVHSRPGAAEAEALGLIMGAVLNICQNQERQYMPGTLVLAHPGPLDMSHRRKRRLHNTSA